MTDDDGMTLISVVIPMHDESANAAVTLAAIGAELEASGADFELIPVDDGSDDDTGAILEDAARRDPRVRPVRYPRNRGRGYALRRGFDAARGDIVASLDADLSYSPDHLTRMVAILNEEPSVDVVVGSPYMPGGAVDGVPPLRLAISRAGNAVLRFSFAEPIHTSTGILRAYRRWVLDALDLQSDDKEIHLEILSKALVLGALVREMPSTLASRRRGASHFRMRSTVTSHLVFSLLQRPARMFGYLGLGLTLLALAAAAYLLDAYLAGSLNPERPLMTIMVLLFLAGQGAVAFSVVASQLSEIEKGLVRNAARLRMLQIGDTDHGDRAQSRFSR